MAPAKASTDLDTAKRIKQLEDEVAVLSKAIEETIAAVEFEETIPMDRLRRALAGSTVYGRWTMIEVLESIQRWAELYGAPPKQAQWNPRSPDSKAEDKEKFYLGDWPTAMQVRRHFPKWNDAIAAAGFTPRTGPENPGGGPTQMEEWPQWTGWGHLQHLRRRMGLTQAQVARLAGVSVGTLNSLEAGRPNTDGGPPNPGVRMLMSLAHVLGVKTGALVDD